MGVLGRFTVQQQKQNIGRRLTKASPNSGNSNNVWNVNTTGNLNNNNANNTNGFVPDCMAITNGQICE